MACFVIEWQSHLKIALLGGKFIKGDFGSSGGD